MEVWNNYQDVRSREYIEDLIASTASEIRAVCDGKKAAYAWSGGKDSIALQICCEDAGVKRGFCAYNDLYFTESIDFFQTHRPDGVELYNSGEDEKWLAEHPKFLFPVHPHIWNVQTHLKYQPIYVKKNGIDVLMMGKRTQDGNWVSKDLTPTNGKGVTIYCPIRDWVHEDVICAIRYRGKELSPFYFTSVGFHYGDTKFPVMKPFGKETVDDAWDRIYKIEPRKVLRSAKYGIESAKDYCEKRGIFYDL
jgi:hypothetical protein